MNPLRSTLLTALLLLPLQAQQRLTFDLASIPPSRADTLDGGLKALPEGAGHTAKTSPSSS